MINLLKTHSFFVTKTIESCTLLENQGYCNENYLVVADGVKYIVRKLLRDDIDRALEIANGISDEEYRSKALASIASKTDDKALLIRTFEIANNKYFTENLLIILF